MHPADEDMALIKIRPTCPLAIVPRQRSHLTLIAYYTSRYMLQLNIKVQPFRWSGVLALLAWPWLWIHLL